MPIFKTKNENFFKIWSPEMAYVLGFFAADGTMIKNKRGAHFIEFGITDYDLLLEIRKTLNSNHKITIRTYEKNKNWKTQYRLQIGCKEMFNDLIKLGLTPKKSLILKMPNVPNEFFSHFIRGYFDGDGNVTICRYRRVDRNNNFYTIITCGFTCGSEDFLVNLKRKLTELANIIGGTLCFSSRGYRLYFARKNSLKLYNYIYKNCENKLFLNRKKVIFEKFFGLN